MVEIPSFQWSELARRSAEVGAALDEHGEVMVKRGAQTLRLAPKDSDETVLITRDLFHLLTGLASCDSPELVSKALTTAWPWTRSLPAHDQILLVKEVAPIAEMCVSLGVYRPLLEEIASWRRTARAWADGCTPIGPINEPYGALARRPNA